MARCRERTVEFARNAVRIAKENVSAPLGTITSFVLHRQPSRLRKVDVAAFRAIHLESKLQIGRRVILLVHGNQQAALPVTLGNLVAHPVELSECREPGQELV